MIDHILWSGILQEKFVELGPEGYGFTEGPAELLVFNNKVKRILTSLCGKKVKIILQEED